MSTTIIPKGCHAYDVIVGANTRQPPLNTVESLAVRFPADFAEAANALNPDEWRLLYEVHHYSIYALTDPTFDVVRAIVDVLEEPQNTEHLSQEQIGSDRSVDDIALSIRWKLADLPSDVQKALWSILGPVNTTVVQAR